jgi:hypothetical protein
LGGHQGFSAINKGPYDKAVIIKKDEYLQINGENSQVPASTRRVMGSWPITIWAPFFSLSPDVQILDLLHD